MPSAYVELQIRILQIVHINYSDKTGGAAIAAFRHNEALNRAGISSSMLVAEKTTHTPSVHQPTGYKHCIVFRNYFQRYYPYCGCTRSIHMHYGRSITSVTIWLEKSVSGRRT